MKTHRKMGKRSVLIFALAALSVAAKAHLLHHLYKSGHQR